MTAWASNTSSGGGGYLMYYTSNPNGLSQTIVQGNSTAMQSVTLVQELSEISAAITRRPDHEFVADEDGCFCAECPPNSIYIDDRGAHLYVIREWEIG